MRGITPRDTIRLQHRVGNLFGRETALNRVTHLAKPQTVPSRPMGNQLTIKEPKTQTGVSVHGQSLNLYSTVLPSSTASGSEHDSKKTKGTKMDGRGDAK
jgi:hypothetical protein